jgi:hypothetical protein
MIINLIKNLESEEIVEIRNSPEEMDYQKFEIRCSLLFKISNIQHRIKNDELAGNDLFGVGLL